MIKVIINGCNGAMGQVLSNVISENKDMTIIAGIDRFTTKYENDYKVYDNFLDFNGDCDVVIDFSNPSCLSSLLDYGVKNKTPLVIATTGLNEKDLEEIKKASEFIPIIRSANTSLGINVLINLVKKAALVLSENFDIEIIEKHHNKKVDSPSGTAYMIANAMNEEFNNSYEYVYGREGNENKRIKKEIGIHAIRGGTIPGEHTVIFAGNDELIEIKHTALSKKVFAEGAVGAAKFIITKENGLFDMNDLINK